MRFVIGLLIGAAAGFGITSYLSKRTDHPPRPQDNR
jgi:hypothetical protein